MKKVGHRCIARPNGKNGSTCGGTPEQHSIKNPVVRVWDDKKSTFNTYPIHNFVIGGQGED